MQLDFQQNHHRNAITACDRHGISINDAVFQSSLIVGPEQLHSDWPVTALEQIDLALLQPVLDARPEILLIGTGTRQQLPDIGLLQALLEHEIVAEFMHTAAACRTFNILLDEQRDVMAALIWQADSSSDPVAPRCA